MSMEPNINPDHERYSINKFLHNLNTNFRRKTLKELLEEEKPYVIVNGQRHRIKKRELELLKEIASENLKIPITLEFDSSLECGTIKVEGKEEIKVVSKILGKELDMFNEEKILYIYKPELRILRRELPTTTMYLFRMGLD
ncbi:MAG: uncharacterized protein PWP15_498 [Methanothermococcus sp.]|uniref:DUF61 family protein n=2 Tax=Methanothermococcus TaxID=155862 RepID=UPI00035C3E0B|nr:uncharacterized protein [Methanothermococcus sp.]MDK2986894.1 uncharacterized protein [Methanothermococcus sp.]